MAAPLDPAAALIALADALHRGELPPAPVRAHTIRAVAAWSRGAPLERAFGLRPASRDYSTRNAALLAAGRALGEDPQRLARAVHDFETRRWPRWRAHEQPPEHAAAVDRHLFCAFRSGRRVPRSAKQLRRILQDRRAA